MNVFRALVQSRKFWLALVGAAVAGALVVRGEITVEQFIDAVLVLVSVLIGSIALEDAAEKSGSKTVTEVYGEAPDA